MITTIQLHDKVKKALNKLKKTDKESYEEIIVKMRHTIKNKNNF